LPFRSKQPVHACTTPPLLLPELPPLLFPLLPDDEEPLEPVSTKNPPESLEPELEAGVPPSTGPPGTKTEPLSPPQPHSQMGTRANRDAAEIPRVELRIAHLWGRRTGRGQVAPLILISIPADLTS
jgi:hypothetical protein